MEGETSFRMGRIIRHEQLGFRVLLGSEARGRAPWPRLDRCDNEVLDADGLYQLVRQSTVDCRTCARGSDERVAGVSAAAVAYEGKR